MCSIQSQPMRRGRPPAYPTALAVAADPDLLRRCLPAPWLSHKQLTQAVGIALSAGAVGGSTGCIGWMGCIVVAPPARMPEEEALQILKHELAQENIHLPRTNYEIPGVTVSGWPDDPRPVVADLASDDGRIAVEYLSVPDLKELYGSSWQWSWTEERELERRVRAQTRDTRFGVFYLLQTPAPGDWLEPTEDEAREQLRHQIVEFVEWLKGQGVL